ncbi:hypothetical protein [Methylomonas sp. AM2-LC]|uniref:hypothetical protein n=1 Tax=Methylomonas sp. AM2-LC TaxID=3153301 RepID=UPI003263FCAF
MNEIDAKALNILKKYNLLKPDATSPEDFLLAQQKGLMFDKVNVFHDEAVNKCFDSFSNARKQHFTNLFLVSLSQNRLDYRSGLAAFAIMQSFPNHAFAGTNPDCCIICSYPPNREVSFSAINQFRFLCGGLYSAKPTEIYFFLDQHNALTDIYPSAVDFEIFLEILQVIKSVDDTCTVTTLQKILNKLPSFRSTKEQIKYFLETLGYCGILETANHPGLLHQYVNLGLAPRKTHSSDWKYPVDFWTGKDGINLEALQFWFGAYKELNI